MAHSMKFKTMEDIQQLENGTVICTKSPTAETEPKADILERIINIRLLKLNDTIWASLTAGFGWRWDRDMDRQQLCLKWSDIRPR